MEALIVSLVSMLIETAEWICPKVIWRTISCRILIESANSVYDISDSMISSSSNLKSNNVGWGFGFGLKKKTVICISKRVCYDMRMQSVNDQVRKCNFPLYKLEKIKSGVYLFDAQQGVLLQIFYVNIFNGQSVEKTIIDPANINGCM